MTKDPTTIETNEKSLTIDRVYMTSPERLFQAWTDPALACQWLAPGPMKCSIPIYEPRKGGRFRIEMSGHGPDGKPMTMTYDGTFDDVTPGKRIVMLWPPAMPGVDPDADDPPSVVTITFTPVVGGTRLRLTQDGMPSKEGAGHAAMGWASTFEKLAGIL
jgi:uncharacterized protein YndB with AHSA1/START domain